MATKIIKEVHISCDIPNPPHSYETSNPVKLATVATVANFTGLLVSFEWGGFGISQEIWTSFIILVATGIASYTFIKNKTIWYLLPIIWAFYGIYFKHTSGILEINYTLIIKALIFGIGVLSFFLIRGIYNETRLGIGNKF